MDIPVKADVYCADGPCGHATQVIVDPITDRVTHVVVAERGLLGVEHLIPLHQVVDSTPKLIHLRCTSEELTKFDTFIETEYTPGDNPETLYGPAEWAMWPYVIPEPDWLALEYENIPPGEL